ncbi:uncharacterized protein METZ01_LOCUS329727, partial [marine metagenome]
MQGQYSLSPKRGAASPFSAQLSYFIMKKQSILVVVALGLATSGSAPAQSQAPTPSKPVTSSKTAAKPTTVKPDFPSYTTVIKGYEQIISSM